MIQTLISNDIASMATIKELRHKTAKLEISNNELIIQNRNIMEECKELQLSLNQTRNELNKLKQERIMDPSRYEQWNADNLITWICNLDGGKYNKYRQKLMKAFNNEGVNGSNVHHLDKQELRGFGVDSFSDRANIYQHIQALVNAGNNKQNEMHNDQVALAQNEGHHGTDYM